jgi:hypothetical protein
MFQQLLVLLLQQLQLQQLLQPLHQLLLLQHHLDIVLHSVEMEPLSNGQVLYLVLTHRHKQEQTLMLLPTGIVNLVQLSQQHQHVLELLQQELPQPPLQELPQLQQELLQLEQQLQQRLIQEVLEHNVLL